MTSRLFLLRHHPAFPDPDLAPERDALNCVRILTRVLPYVYEKADSLQAWEERFFWGKRRRRARRSSSTAASEVLFDEGREDGHESQPLQQRQQQEEDKFEDAKPLGEELVDALVDLLFFADLTVPRPSQNSWGGPDGGGRAANKVTYAIWQSGVGCNATVATTREYESNRCEILRLLLTLAGRSMYLSPSALPAQGIRTLTYICTCSDKQIVLSVLCSLLNTVSLHRHRFGTVDGGQLTAQLANPGSPGRLSSTTRLAGGSRTTAWSSRTLSCSS